MYTLENSIIDKLLSGFESYYECESFDPERYNMINGELVEREDFKKKQKEKEVIASRFLSEKEANKLSELKELKDKAIAAWDEKIDYQTKIFEATVKTMKDKESELDKMK